MTRKYSCPAPFYRDFHSLLKKRKNRKRLRTAVIQPIIFYFCFGGGGEREKRNAQAASVGRTSHTTHSTQFLPLVLLRSPFVSSDFANSACRCLALDWRRVALLPPLPPPFYLSDMAFFAGGGVKLSCSSSVCDFLLAFCLR